MDKNSFENYEKRIEKDFEKSTIFNSEKTENKAKYKKKDNRYKKLLSVLICILIVLSVCVFAIANFWPVEEQEEIKTSEKTYNLTAKANVSLENMKNAKKDAVTNVSKIYFENKNGKFSLTPFLAKEKDENGDIQKTVNFKLFGMDKNVPLNQSTLNSFYDSLFTVYANSKLEGKYTEKDCGLDKPRVFIKVTMADNSSFTIKIGDTSPISKKYYISTSLTKGIYVTDCDVYEIFSVSQNDLVDLNLVNAITENDTNSEYFSNGTLYYYDSINLKGENFKNETKLTYKDDSEDVMVYYIDSPIKAYASNTSIETLLNPLSSGLSADFALKIKPDSSDLKKYGLDNPYLAVNYKVQNKTCSVKFGAAGGFKADYLTCMVDDVPVVYLVSTSSVGFINWSLNDLRYDNLYAKNIENIKSYTIEYNGKKYKYDLSFDKATEETDEVSTDEEILTVLLDNKPVNADDFKTGYQRFLMASASKYLGENKTLSIKPTLKITIKLKGNKTDVITYQKYNSNYYLHKLNGIGDELIPARTVDLLIKNYEKLRKGEKVQSPNNQQ